MLEEEAWKTKADKAVTATDRLICITQGNRCKIQVFKNFHRLFSRRLCRFRRGGGKASLAPQPGNFHTIPESQGSSLWPLLLLPFPLKEKSTVTSRAGWGVSSQGGVHWPQIPRLGASESSRLPSQPQGGSPLPDYQPVRGEERATETTRSCLLGSSHPETLQSQRDVLPPLVKSLSAVLRRLSKATRYNSLAHINLFLLKADRRLRVRFTRTPHTDFRVKPESESQMRHPPPVRCRGHKLSEPFPHLH